MSKSLDRVSLATGLFALADACFLVAATTVAEMEPLSDARDEESLFGKYRAASELLAATRRNLEDGIAELDQLSQSHAQVAEFLRCSAEARLEILNRHPYANRSRL